MRTITLPSGTRIPIDTIIRWIDGFMSEEEMADLTIADWKYLKAEWMVDPIDA
jgi:hypothetical protein